PLASPPGCPIRAVCAVCRNPPNRSRGMNRNLWSDHDEPGSFACAMTVPRDAVEFPPVLTAALAAELLQVHVEYLRQMVRDGRVPCHRFPEGRELRFLRDELLAWLAAQPGFDRSQGARRQPDAARTHTTESIGT